MVMRKNILRTFIVLFIAAVILTSCGGGGGGSGAAPVATTSNETATTVVGNFTVAGTSYKSLTLNDNGTFKLNGNHITTTGTYTSSNRSVGAGSYELTLSDLTKFYVTYDSETATFVSGTASASGTANYHINAEEQHCPICGKRIHNLLNNNTEVVAECFTPEGLVIISFMCNDCGYIASIPLSRAQIVCNSADGEAEADDLFDPSTWHRGH